MTRLQVLLEELRVFHRESKEQLMIIKEETRKANTRINEAEERLEKTEDKTQNTKIVIAELLKLHVKLEDKLADLESRSRRENVSIYGVPEGTGKDLESAFVETLLKEGLGLDGNGADLQIELAHRCELGPQLENAPPHSIVVRFLSFKIKESLLRKAWQHKGIV